MWNCQFCHCQAIAGSVLNCPMCQAPRFPPGLSQSPGEVTAVVPEVEAQAAPAVPPEAAETPPETTQAA